MSSAFYGLPFRVRVPASNPPIVDRINTVNEALRDIGGKTHVMVHPDCVELLTDLREMKPDAHGLIDKQEHKRSHSSDCLGYMCCYLRPLYHAGPQNRAPGGKYG